MLRELHISNLAVIEDACIELSGGLNCFTGQTGAGKSLIIGAFEMLLGLRSAGADMLRIGAEEARISGVFEVRDPSVARAIEAAADLTLTAGEPLLITRKLHASGRSSASVNGQPATTAMIRAIGELLVDVHGQHDHQYLLKPSNQLLVLDGFGRCLDLREEFAAVYHEVLDLKQRLRDLGASQTLRRQQLDLYEFQAQEIDAADPQPGEYAELKARHSLLTNLQKLKRDAGQAYAAMYDSEGSIIERLQILSHLLGDLSQLDEELRAISDQVRSSTLSLQDTAFELSRYVDRLDHDPREMAEVEERLNTLNRLIAKYGANRRPTARRGGETAPASANDPVAEVIAHRVQIQEQLDKLRGDDADSSQLESKLADLSDRLIEIGGRLSEQRRTAARKLAPLVQAELRELGMADAELEVEFTGKGDFDEEPAQNAAGAHTTSTSAATPDAGLRPQDSGLKTPAPTTTGFDRVEMLVRTNPGQPARPLRKIASGGELSRIMLALKSVLAHSDRISVLVFDEIDANIGGRMGTVIGQKLRELAAGVCPRGAETKAKSVKSKGKAAKGSKLSANGAAAASDANDGSGDHQILCITHLPQIAAFADRHMRIAKAVTGKGDARQTVTTVTLLQGKDRIEELAEMLAGKGVTETTRKQVEELIEAAG